MTDLDEPDDICGAPAKAGYAMPAEWSPHQATWISWPHNPDTWPGVLAQAEAAMAQAVAALASGETVRINVLDSEPLEGSMS